MNLTAPQQKTLDVVRRLIEARGYSPTTNEIMVAGGWRSTATVNYHLDRLRRLGLITYNRSPRTIRIVEPWDADDA